VRGGERANPKRDIKVREREQTLRNKKVREGERREERDSTDDAESASHKVPLTILNNQNYFYPKRNDPIVTEKRKKIP